MIKPKISILWTRLSGYINACLEELARETSDLVLVRQPINQQEAPFNEDEFSWISKQFNGCTEFKQATEAIAEQNPDILIVCGWLNKDYTRLARFYKRRETFVVGTCDNPWNNTLKQKIAALTSSFHVKRYFDCIWVPGHKAASFAAKLKFNSSQVINGLYTCDTEKFQEAFKIRYHGLQVFPKNFLYIGRYVESKGIKTLLNAYQLYREDCIQNHWQLWFSGSGPLEAVIDSSPNVKNYGFTQPGKLADLFSKVGVLVLPSHQENWGVVVHEASSAGLPIICTDVCGSSLELVENSVSGFIIPPKDPIALSQTMKDMTSKNDEELWQLSQRSYEKSLSYSPQRWVQELIDAYKRYTKN